MGAKIFSFCLFSLLLTISALRCPTDNNVYAQGVYPNVKQLLPRGTQLSAGFNFTTAATAGTQEYDFYNITIQIGITCSNGADISRERHGDVSKEVSPVKSLRGSSYYQALHFVDVHYPNIRAGTTTPGPNAADQGSLTTIGTSCPESFVLSQGPPALFASLASNHRTSPKVSLHLTLVIPNGFSAVASGPFVKIAVPTYPLLCAPSTCPNVSNLILTGNYPPVKEFNAEATIGAGFIFTTPSDAGIRNYTFYNLTVTYTLAIVDSSAANNAIAADDLMVINSAIVVKRPRCISADLSPHNCIRVTFPIPDQHYNNVPGGVSLPLIVTDQSGIVNLPPTPGGEYFFSNVPPILTGFVASTEDAIVLQVAAIFSLHTAVNATGQRSLLGRGISDFAPLLQGTYPIICAPVPRPCGTIPNINVIGSYPGGSHFTEEVEIVASYSFITPANVGTQNYTFYNLSYMYQGHCGNGGQSQVNISGRVNFANFLYINVAAGTTVTGQVTHAVPTSAPPCFFTNIPILTGFLASSDPNTVIAVIFTIDIAGSGETQNSAANSPGSYPQECNTAPVPCTSKPNFKIIGDYPSSNPGFTSFIANYRFTTPINAPVQNYTFYNVTVTYYVSCGDALLPIRTVKARIPNFTYVAIGPNVTINSTVNATIEITQTQAYFCVFDGSPVLRGFISTNVISVAVNVSFITQNDGASSVTPPIPIAPPSYPQECFAAPNPCANKPNINLIGNYGTNVNARNLSAGYSFITPINAPVQNYILTDVTFTYTRVCLIHGVSSTKTIARKFVNFVFANVEPNTTVASVINVTVRLRSSQNIKCSFGLKAPRLTGFIFTNDMSVIVDIILTIDISGEIVTAGPKAISPASYPDVCNTAPVPCTNMPNIHTTTATPGGFKGGLVTASYTFHIPAAAVTQNYTVQDLVFNIQGQCTGAGRLFPFNISLEFSDTTYANIMGGTLVASSQNVSTLLVPIVRPGFPSSCSFNMRPTLIGYFASSSSAIRAEFALTVTLARKVIAGPPIPIAPPSYPQECFVRPNPCPSRININLSGKYPTGQVIGDTISTTYSFITPMTAGVQSYTFYDLTFSYHGFCQNLRSPKERFGSMLSLADATYTNIAANSTVIGSVSASARLPLGTFCRFTVAPQLRGFLASTGNNVTVTINLLIKLSFGGNTISTGTNNPASYPSFCAN